MIASGARRPAATSPASRRAARGDLLARAVIEGDDEDQPGIAARQLLGLLQQAADLGVEIVALADDAHPHVVAMQLGKIVADEAAQQPHQVADFRRRPRPVLRAEGEEGENADAEIAGRADGAAQRLDAAPMALAARQSALRPPSGRCRP